MERRKMRLEAPVEVARRIDWPTTVTWLIPFTLIVWLGLHGGGYDAIEHDQVGLAVWWVVLLGVLVGAFPRRGVTLLTWAALGLLSGFAIWTALSAIWSESVGNTAAVTALVVLYLGVFALGVSMRGEGWARVAVGAVASGITVIAVVALLSRLHPTWFPEADQTARFLLDSRERLSFPLNYWNGLAALLAVGVPLLLQLGSDARSIATRAAATAALSVLALTIFLTLSRGGIAAAGLAVVVYLLLAPDRLPKIAIAVLAATGSLMLILAASSRDALREGLLGATAQQQGNDLMVITILVVVVLALVRACAALVGRRLERPGWTRVSRRAATISLGVGIGLLLVAAVALDAPGRASDAWDEFRHGPSPGAGAGRLSSISGESRYQLWDVAWQQNASAPLNGTGAGTYEFWWTRAGDGGESVLDAHSLYLQTLGELGVVGLTLLAAFLLIVLVGGVQLALLSESSQRSLLAAALAGCLAFLISAAVDWTWEIAVLPVSVMLLASVLVGPVGSAGSGGLRLPPRLVAALAAVAAIVAIAVPFAVADLLRASEADYRAGELSGALDKARSARNVMPAAASPRLQEALVLEAGGELGAAVVAAAEATEREPNNWATWLVLSRIQAERGRARAAVAAYLKARALNPFSPLFER